MSDTVFVAAIAAAAVVLSAVAAACSAIAVALINRTHTLINGRMDELLRITRAEGVVEGESHRDERGAPG